MVHAILPAVVLTNFVISICAVVYTTLTIAKTYMLNRSSVAVLLTDDK